MSERENSSSNSSSVPRDPKRRRVDDAAAAEGAAGSNGGAADAYPPWHDASQNHHAASSSAAAAPVPAHPFAPAQDVSAYAASGAEYNHSNHHPPPPPPQGLSEGSHWQHADPATYPELAQYSHQPYFYQQQTSTAANAGPWPATSDSQSHAGLPSAPTTTLSRGESSASTTMPYFPSSTAGTAAAISEALDASTLNYSEGGNAAQYQAYGAAGSGALHRDSSSFYFDDAGMHLKIQSLPILDNLATQLIHTISKASYPQIQDMMRSDGSEDGQAYRTLKNLFDQTRKVYSRETPFIDAIAIQMFQPTQQEIIRKANIATFISSILGAHDVSFFHLNELFMETFVPLGHRLLKWQGAIYLELKTQTFISALMNSDGNPEEMLEELFPPDLDAQILTRHPDAPSLSPSEQDFIDRSRARKSYLLAEPRTEENLRELPKKYQWGDFVREFASCITKNVDGIMNVPARSQATANSKGANAEINGQAGSAANSALAAVQGLAVNGKAGDGAGGKKGATAASTVRQPWTKPEEDALLSGLERVNGPHWSQILALYGRGGSVSEVLKDRNQVQLKDKARNLKLWYLKTGKEVPPALRGVTGELRKRGGARARAALGITDDDQAAGGGGPDEDVEMNEGEADPEKSGSGKKKKAKK
ncbi:Transcription factor TBF1 [Cercospora beticola]|nr:Transcription factor TBF1 [Cercospora beticola]PIA88782.1 Transcription factor TBF1 [Cercospora beticola]